MRTYHRWMPLLVLGLLLLGAVPALACPNCKNSLPDTDDVGAITRLRDGYFWSYISMSSMPFIAVGVIGYNLFKRIKQADAIAEAESNTK